ncbi:beta-glucuronidase [Colletotrichum orchidophilum]|uniref:Beta-glucuronidase n=1 Tax=Colletotrichum orchidophilum TaxID=1209926 RepID=A0A1G4BK52_9PEZI|nr:beta-glucuronidase [Colletotrichum orchidophilum]OHF01715.1 beta-glucuronidase [Colletotrichum orchidophilum]
MKSQIAPGEAHLYKICVQVLSDFNKEDILDTYELSLDTRTTLVRDNRLLINGKRFCFTGFGKHEDTLIWGRGFDPACMIHDFHLMNRLVANSFRASHYPYADRHGIFVIHETPAEGLHLGLIAGVLGLGEPPTFAPELCNEKTQAAHEQAI